MSQTSQRRASAAVRLYIAASVVVAAATGLLGFRVDPEVAWGALVGFGLLAFLAEQFPITVAIGTTYSVTFVLSLAAMVALGPVEATLVALFGVISLRDVRDRPTHRHLFNAAQLVISAGMAGIVYHLVAEQLGVGAHALSPMIVAPLLAATLVNFLINTSLVSGAVALSERRPFADIWRRGYAVVGQTYLAFAAMGFILGVLYVQMDSLSPVFFLLMPLLVARHAFQAAVAMEGAYDSTVRSLISAIEAKDPYTSGHAGRVAELSQMVARAYGLPAQDQRKIKYAALMHDVGKLVVLNKILQKPGKLTDEEYEHMKAHPVHGVEIVSEIDLLDDALVGVRHHHERMDGRGYPDGLIGDQIPLFARLIMVADAFDSMTSTRSYRKAKSIEEAFAELHRCAGTQFDPDAIVALERAVAKEGWQPHPETEDLFGHPVPDSGDGRRDHRDGQVASI